MEVGDCEEWFQVVLGTGESIEKVCGLMEIFFLFSMVYPFMSGLSVARCFIQQIVLLRPSNLDCLFSSRIFILCISFFLTHVMKEFGNSVCVCVCCLSSAV